MTKTFTRKSACLVLFFISFLLYANTLSQGFVWDDHYLIEENPHLQSPREIAHFFTKDFWQNSSVPFNSGFYRPLTLLSFFVNHHLWQGQPFGFHLFNVLLHGINGVFVFLLFVRLSKETRLSFLGALIFLIHPVQTEAVAYIADVNDLLATCFLLFTFHYYLNYAKSSRVRDIVWSLIFFVLSLLSKESAMAGWGLLLLLEWFFISKFNKKDFTRRIPALGLYFLLLLVYIAVRILILGKMNAVTTLENVRYVSVLPSFGLWSHLLTTAKIISLYLKLCFFPWDLSISYVVLPAVTLFSPYAFAAAVAVLSSLALIFLCTKENVRWLSFSLAWFFLSILPLSNLIPISNTIAERFLYLPLIGYAFFLSNAVVLLEKKLKETRAGFVLFSVILLTLIFAFSWKTTSRNFVWGSDFTLFKSALGAAPCAPIAHKNLSVYYFQRQRLREGLEEDEKYRACLSLIQDEYRILRSMVKND